MLKILICGEYDYAIAVNDTTEPTVEVDELDLTLLGKGKKFDIENNIIIDDPQSRISYLKMLLRDSDYQAIKYMEGQLSAEEYEPIKQQRIKWRQEINELELSL